MDIQKIINLAIELDKNFIKEHFDLHQKGSGIRPELFFALLKAELKIQRNGLSYKNHTLDRYMWLASQFDILEEIIDKELELHRETNQNSSGSIWTPDEGLNSKDLPPNFESDKLDCTASGEKEDPINTMPIEMIINHFSPLKYKKNKGKVIWMEESDFDLFIKRSFLGQLNLSKPKINLAIGDKYAIIKLFHSFYSKSSIGSYSFDNKKDRYIRLLENAFDTEVFKGIKNDDFKSNKSKYIW